jgi:hypothetical protein
MYAKPHTSTHVYISDKPAQQQDMPSSFRVTVSDPLISDSARYMSQKSTRPLDTVQCAGCLDTDHQQTIMYKNSK